MTRSEHADETRTTAPGAGQCCRRPMSVIEVTSPPGSAAATLALYTCSACGRHVWQRDGEVIEGDAVLSAVKERLADLPARRAPAPRAKPARAPAPEAVQDDLRERLSGFTVHGA